MAEVNTIKSQKQLTEQKYAYRNALYILFVFFFFLTVSSAVNDSDLVLLFSVLSISCFVIGVVINVTTNNSLVNTWVSNTQSYKDSIKDNYDDLDFFNLLNGIGYSDEKRNIYQFSRYDVDEEMIITEIPYDSIFEAEIYEDGVMVSKVNKKGLVAGSLVGGALFGGAGAVVGAMGSDKTEDQQLKKIHLIIRVNDMKSPRHTIVVLEDLENGINKKSAMYIENVVMLEKWLDRLKLIIANNKLNH